MLQSQTAEFVAELPIFDIDAESALSQLSGLDIKGLMRFEPCGQGNRRPVLVSRGMQLVNARPVGADQSHLKLTLKDGLTTWPAIAFRQAGAQLAERVDIVYSLTREWRSERIELEILDIAPAFESRVLER